MFEKIKGFFKNLGKKIKEGFEKVVNWFKKNGADVAKEVLTATACVGISALIFALYKRVGAVLSPVTRIAGWIGIAALIGVLEMATERYIDSEIKDFMDFNSAVHDMVEDGFSGLYFEEE